MPIGIDDQGGHGGDWRRLVDGDALLVQIHPVCVLSAHKPEAMSKPDRDGLPPGQLSSMKGAIDWNPKRVTDQQGKDRGYWIDEIAFLEARLNGIRVTTTAKIEPLARKPWSSESELGSLSVNPGLTETRATTRV